MVSTLHIAAWIHQLHQPTKSLEHKHGSHVLSFHTSPASFCSSKTSKDTASSPSPPPPLLPISQRTPVPNMHPHTCAYIHTGCKTHARDRRLGATPDVIKVIRKRSNRGKAGQALSSPGLRLLSPWALCSKALKAARAWGWVWGGSR